MFDCSCCPTQNMQAYLNVQSVACMNELLTVVYLGVPTTLLLGCWIFASLGCWKIDKFIFHTQKVACCHSNGQIWLLFKIFGKKL